MVRLILSSVRELPWIGCPGVKRSSATEVLQSIVRTLEKPPSIDETVPTCTRGLLKNKGHCISCKKARRKAGPQQPRKPLSEMSRNSVRSNGSGEKKARERPPRPKNGCLRCLVNVCNTPKCWNEHN
ncbi:hypothetical protein K469DRAFT_361264 [Zopfia rhizophila CBS 207.26]|uniref:Uncharacterized protein n=1 Tax=Zopfia rhizophila CBS 207.26 TaxID=1314779 RepID=A0A6A6EI43_9PEZI|nr:hypothetical protein K469DRAFT_361264 [Zopfia rhizophila CBS 207.26]